MIDKKTKLLAVGVVAPVLMVLGYLSGDAVGGFVYANTHNEYIGTYGPPFGEPFVRAPVHGVIDRGGGLP